MINPFFKNKGPYKFCEIQNVLNLKIDQINKDIEITDIKDLQNSKKK